MSRRRVRERAPAAVWPLAGPLPDQRRPPAHRPRRPSPPRPTRPGYLARSRPTCAGGQWSDPSAGPHHLRGVGCSLGGHHGQPAANTRATYPTCCAGSCCRPSGRCRWPPGCDGRPGVAGQAGSTAVGAEHAGQGLPAAVAHPGHGRRERATCPQPLHHQGAATEPAPRCGSPPWPRSRPWPTPSPRAIRALVLVAAYGGLRWGELVGLRVRRVDLLHAGSPWPSRLAEVRGQLAVGPPKTERRPTHGDPADGRGRGAWPSTWPTMPSPARMGWCSRPSRAGLSAPSNFTRRVWIPATRAVGVEGLRVP